MKKLIATILIIGFVLTLNFNIFQPKQAQAIPVIDVLKVPIQAPLTLKEIIFDMIGHTITQTILRVIQQQIINWGMGRKSTANQPFQVSDWVQFFRDATNRGAAKFISQYEGIFDLSSVCEFNLKNTLDSLGFNLYPQDMTYSQYARPTLENTLTTLGLTCQEFTDSGYSIAQGGWGSWFALMEPQNNVFGQAMMAEQEKARQMMEEKEAADKRLAVSGGYENETATIATDIDKCKENCAAVGPPSPACLARCESLPGIAIQTQIKNWGSDINKLMTKSLGADIDRLVSVDEITELLGVLYSAVLSKAINQGLAFGTSLLQPNQSTRKRAETKTQFSYQRIFKKEQTVEDIKDVKSQTLSNILKAMQQLSRSVTTCVDDELMKYDDYTKSLADIFSPSVEGLYLGLEGVNLKPDFEVLDPRFAPYTVYGYSWGKVPASKFPDKCKAMTDQLNLGTNATCRSIRSGLEPNIQPQCEICMYDHDSLNCPPAPYPPQPYPKTGQTDPWSNETLMKDKSDYWWDCKNQYNVTLDRCDKCLKNADEKCQQDNPKQKEQCIINQCGSFSDIANNFITPLPIDPDSAALEFHDRCLKEEAKDACFTCLKEYFVPATYCDQTADYMARSIIKYPALVKKVRSGATDHEIWLGPYDKIMGEQGGGVCDNNDESESIDLAIICRIMPDFKYAGEKVCETRCSQAGLTGQALTDALKDISDFRPNGKDCGSIKLPIGGKETWAPVNDGVFQTRGKCCGALWQHDPKKYAACVGGGTEIPIKPTTCGTTTNYLQEPWCHCPEGWRPLIGRTRTGNTEFGKVPLGGDCNSKNFDNPNKPLLVFSNHDALFDILYIANSGNKCTETCEAINNVDPNFVDSLSNAQDYWNQCPNVCRDENFSLPPDDPNGPHKCPTDATPPASVLWSGEVTLDPAEPPNHGNGTWCVPAAIINSGTNELNAGIYHDDNNDGPQQNPLTEEASSQINVCAPCDPGDYDYPYYRIKDAEGNKIDQCNNKQHNQKFKLDTCDGYNIP